MKSSTYDASLPRLEKVALLRGMQRPLELVPKLFGEIRERYLSRPGGYTRVLRIEPLKDDQAPSAILELVDGPKDMRFAMTARTLAHQRVKGNEINDLTAKNIMKVTRYREGGEKALEKLASRFEVEERSKEKESTGTSGQGRDR